MKVKVRTGLVIKSFLIWLAVSTTLANSPVGNSDILIIDKKEFLSVVVDDGKYYTKNCADVSKCFSLPDKLEYYPNQNILFSLCFQSGGSPKFASLKSNKDKIEVCIKEKSIVDLGHLMESYNKQVKSPLK